MRASEFVNEGVKLDQDIIDLVKISWDEGKTPKEISSDLGIPAINVKSILRVHYPDRAGKKQMISRSATDLDKKNIVVDFQNGMNTTDIAKEYNVTDAFVRRLVAATLGQEAYDQEINRRRSVATSYTPNKISSDMLPMVIRLYRQGNTLEHIATQLPVSVSIQSILQKLKRLPNWLDIRHDYEKNRQPRSTKQVTTKKTRSGMIGNQHSKGPQSIHTSGVHWPKYGE